MFARTTSALAIALIVLAATGWAARSVRAQAPDPVRVAMVTALYETVLGREPDQGGLDGYVASGLTQQQIRDLMLASDECIAGLGGECARIAMVSALYRSVLGREPDQGGLDGYVASGLTQQQIRDLMLASDECIAGLGGECARIAMVSALYRSVLGREPDQGGRDGYVASGLTQQQIRDLMLASDECIAGLGGECARIAMVSALYRSVLGREPDQGGLDGYVASGLTQQQIRDLMLVSDECLQGFGGECRDRVAMVGALYRSVLGRDPDGGGLAFYIASRLTQSQIHDLMLASDECHLGLGGECLERYGHHLPPVITVPADRTVPATSAAGAVVSFTVTAADPAGGTIPVTCTPATDSTFPIGTTIVHCTAALPGDPANTATSTFNVTVTDADLTIATHPDITVPATSGAGAIATYTPPVATDVESVPVVTCAPASGGTFAIGTTTVTCTATAAGDATSPATNTFKVIVVTICAPGAGPGDDRRQEDASRASGTGGDRDRPVAKDPCAIVLAPSASITMLPGSHTVTATVKEWGVPAAGKTVTFAVLTGPNRSVTGTAVTNATGLATFTYAGTTAGSDTIQASYSDSAAHVEHSNIVTKTWVRPPSCRDTAPPGGRGKGAGDRDGAGAGAGDGDGDGDGRGRPSSAAAATVGPAGEGDGARAVCQITLTPGVASVALPGSQTFLATVTEFGLPVTGKTVTFTVLTGPNAGNVLTAATDAAGKANFTYAGTTAGKDTVQAAYTDSAGDILLSAKGTVTWTAPPPPPRGKDR